MTGCGVNYQESKDLRRMTGYEWDNSKHSPGSRINLALVAKPCTLWYLHEVQDRLN